MSKSCLICRWFLLCWAIILSCELAYAASQPSTRPILRIEPQLHFAMIRHMDVDAAERFVVTASDDKTARVWDAITGKLLQTLRPPIGDGDEGKLYAVAISPDGEQVVVAGWTGYEWDNQLSIYIFQRSTGQLQQRIPELPNVILHLAFSKDGSKLAVALGEGGIRLYSRATWQELARDRDYGADSYSVDFDPQGRVLSTSDDGYLRLYSPELKLLRRYPTQAGKQPYFAKFSPDAKHIAVGFNDSRAIEILDARDLTPLTAPATQELDNGDLSTVAWAQDGKRLYAGGRYHNGQGSPLVVWEQGGQGQRLMWQAGQSTLMDIKPLREGGVLYASADPSLARLGADGSTVWQQGSGILNFRTYEPHKRLLLNKTADLVELHYATTTQAGLREAQQRFNLRELSMQPSTGEPLLRPRLKAKGLVIDDLMDSLEPKLNGQVLALEPNESSCSLALDAQGKSFALGTDWTLRLYDAKGEELWQQSVPTAWMVNISQDNRWVVAALGDGTVRWYEKGNGQERLAFYLHPDEKRWVAWTPEGFYALSSPEAESLIGYHINQGADREAKWVGVQQLREVFARGDLVSKALDKDYAELAAQALAKAGDLEAILAKGLPPSLSVAGDLSYSLKQRDFTLKLLAKDQGGGLGRVEYRINGAVVGDAQAKPIGARLPAGQQALERSFTLNQGDNTLTAVVYNKDNQIASDPVTVKVQVDDPVQREPSLYILSIGVTNYRDPSLALKYAASDAKLFAEQWQADNPLFKQVYPTILQDTEATLTGIEEAFHNLANKIQPQDVFILYLAGHGKTEDGRYYFAPQNVIYENKDSFIKQSLGEERLRELIASIQASKRWMILDTCYAGQAVGNLALANTAIARGMENKAAIDRLMQATGTSVIAAASSQQQAYEGIVENNQGHGLLTHVLLKGLKGAANSQEDNMITVDELQNYARTEVPTISQKHWHTEQFPMMQLNGRDFPVFPVER